MSRLPLLHRVKARNDQETPLMDLGRGQKQFVKTGIWAIVKVTHAVLGVGTMSVANVMGPIELRTGVAATQPSPVKDNKKPQELAAAMRKAEEACASGTRQLKRKAAEQISEIPRYKRGFIWEKSSTSSHLSPSALATETAPPLASPPSHLLNDPEIQATLYAMRDYIRVETPFNVDRFEAMLYDHPNQPFVKSVMNSLRYGFWPFDEGNWKDDYDDVIQNYSTKEADFEAIRAFRDDEI